MEKVVDDDFSSALRSHGIHNDVQSIYSHFQFESDESLLLHSELESVKTKWGKKMCVLNEEIRNVEELNSWQLH